MKISLYLPEGTPDPRKFLKSEIAQARNIKSRATRKAVVMGLKKIINAISVTGLYENIAYFTDGDELIREKYNGKCRIYYCGNEYEKYEPEQFDPQLLVVVDGKEACIGTTDGDKIRILWHEDSHIMGKHSAGGWSQQRFARGREQAMKQWLRRIVDVIKDAAQGREIIIGGPGMTKDQLVKEIPT